MITPGAVEGITGPKAAALANITYRQLDYWARQGWVTPSLEAGVGRPGRRIYGPDDVVKLAALGHFGRSGADVGKLGPAIANLDPTSAGGDYLLVGSADGGVEAVPAGGLRRRVAAAGFACVFDPAPLRAALAAPSMADRASSSRRSA